MKYLFTIFAIMMIQSVFAQSITLTPTDDTTLNQADGGISQGGQVNLLARPWTPSWTSRFIIRFDLSSIEGCTIDSAYLVLKERGTFGVSRAIDVHEITTSWTEGAATWASPWTTGGGDYLATPEATWSPVWTGIAKKDSVDLTSSVQSMVDGTTSNYGWLFKIASEDASQQFWEYYAKEYSVAADRPALKVYYSDCTVLPIELLALDASIDKDNVKIAWSTISESNNDYFSIERSHDGLNFEEVGTVQGAGNSSSRLNYVFYDKQPYQGLSYYRLKQIDFDGKHSYSPIKTVYSDLVRVVNVYPNPTKSWMNVAVETPVGTKVDIMVYNSLGQIVIEHKDQVLTTHHTININTADLSPGHYVVRVRTPIGEYIDKEFIKH